jgi:hypothetical protein
MDCYLKVQEHFNGKVKSLFAKHISKVDVELNALGELKNSCNVVGLRSLSTSYSFVKFLSEE